MPRPRHPLYNALSSITEIKLDKYIVTQFDITYTMELSQFSLLKTYFANHFNSLKSPIIEEWYKSLPREDKKKIVRTGNIETDEFFPDEEYE